MILVWTFVGLVIAAVMVINPTLRKVGIVAFVIGGVLFGVLGMGEGRYGLMWLALGLALAIYIGGWIVDEFKG
jgi:hypothetical protein